MPRPPADRPPPPWIDNRQRTRRVDRHALERWTCEALRQLRADGEIGIHLVGPAEMARINWQYLRHEGSTDIITFDHGSTRARLHGELFISVADAVAQAADFGTTWQEELGRYIVHGLLHLQGEDDLEPVARRKMKRRENRLVRLLAGIIPPRSLGPSPRRHG